MPTIVPVSPTAPLVSEAPATNTAVPPTSAPLARPTPTATLQRSTPDAVSDEAVARDRLEDRTEVSKPKTSPTEEPSATFTLVVPTTEIPPTVTPVPTPTSTATPIGLAPLDTLSLKLMPFASGFSKPVYLTHSGDGTGRLFVVEQAGRIQILNDGLVSPTPFLDIISEVGSDGLEQGLLSVAFHPNFVNNGLFFVNYTNRQGDTVIARYNTSDNPDLANLGSQKIVMTIGQPYANHNGGQIAFGPDGYLYVGMGDGGAANDPQNRAQTLGTLLGKVLRIDVDDGDPYGVPQTNPFVGVGQARPEIWSYGWRNPWRFSFDLATSELYVADVGQNQYEEIHVEGAGKSGLNYGWRLMEGSHCFNPNECDPSALGLILPVAEYDHTSGCSITGGYVYRGTQFPALVGTYFYGDYCSGIIWGLRRELDGSWSNVQFLQTGAEISSFGQDEAGDVYLIDHKGTIFLLGN